MTTKELIDVAYQAREMRDQMVAAKRVTADELLSAKAADDQSEKDVEQSQDELIKARDAALDALKNDLS